MWPNRIYRVFQKKCNIAIFSLNLFQRSDYAFSQVFRNQNFEPIPSGHFEHTHSEYKMPWRSLDIIFSPTIFCETWTVSSLHEHAKHNLCWPAMLSMNHIALCSTSRSNLWQKLKVNREFCYFFFRAWIVLPCVSPMISPSFQISLALAARWPDFCFALKPVTEVWSSWLQLNALVPIFIGTSKQWNTWVPKEGHTWQHYYVCVFWAFRAFNILNGNVQSLQMEWARNSDSKTPVKKHNRTSGTDLS